MQKKIRVLIVDDSVVSREMIARGLSFDADIEIAAFAADPFEARDKIIEVRPDVMISDVEMPKMNGIEFARRLLPQYFIPIIMVSAVSNAVFEAMEAGVVDFVAKPDVRSAQGLEAFWRDLRQKVKSAASAKAVQRRASGAPAAAGAPAAPKSAGVSKGMGELIAIGASTGGTEAIFKLLSNLRPTAPGIVIVQHIPPVFSKMFAERLNAQTPFKVKEAESGDILEAGKAFVAPGDRHMKVNKLGDKYRIQCFEGEKVNNHCPSADVLFDSVAKEAGEKAVGVILTGMGYDGAKGLLAMRRKGARTLGQDEASSVVYGMPKVAFDIGAVEVQAALESMPQVLGGWVK